MGNVVITGANRGIGLELVKLYCDRGDSVWAICRQSSPELEATNAKVLTGVDVADFESLPAKLATLSGLKINVLINNAGILRDEQLGNIDVAQISEQFAINAIAPLVIADLLRNQMAQGGKVGFVTSRMGSIEDNTSGGRYGYRMSKAALNAAAMSYARDMHAKGVSVAILHPGYVQTGMVNFRGDVPASLSASRLQQRMDELTLETSGTFWHANGQELPW